MVYALKIKKYSVLFFLITIQIKALERLEMHSTLSI